jgi:hypothetical protein
MHTIHLIVGDVAATPLIEAVTQHEELNGEVVVLKDILHVGPLKTDGMSFSESRSAFWNEAVPDGQQTIQVDDLERLMEISSRLSNDDKPRVWFWMAPAPADVAAYFWLLHFLKKHQGRFSVVNINGLPFLDENGKLFYPDSIGHIPVKEIIKARKLARVTTISEWETDVDEWPRLVTENAGVRIHEGGKRLKSMAVDYYDSVLMQYISNSNQKPNKVINLAISKNKVPTGDLFLHWRLREMAKEGKIELTKGEVRLADGNVSDTIPQSDTDNAEA